MPDGRADDDAFDKIVEGLEMDVSFPEAKPTPEPPEFDDTPDDLDDQHYRNVPPANLFPRTKQGLLALIAVVGAPLVLTCATFAGIWLPRPLVFAIALVFIAGAIWMFSHLPERGRRDDPDDGAAL